MYHSLFIGRNGKTWRKTLSEFCKVNIATCMLGMVARGSHSMSMREKAHAYLFLLLWPRQSLLRRYSAMSDSGPLILLRLVLGSFNSLMNFICLCRKRHRCTSFFLVDSWCRYSSAGARQSPWPLSIFPVLEIRSAGLTRAHETSVQVLQTYQPHAPSPYSTAIGRTGTYASRPCCHSQKRRP